MIFTDPPYGHNNNNNGDLISRWEAALGRGDYIPERDNRPIANDGKEADDVFRGFIIEAERLLSPGCCCCCCCGGGGPDPMFARWSLWLDQTPGLVFKQMIVWDKGPMGMGWHYRRSYETVLVAQKTGAACRWFDTSHKVENIIRHIPKIIPSANDHPTEKPVNLAAHFIRLHSKPGDLVLDPFAGYGTTGIAAVRMGRGFIGIELNPAYCEMARRRIYGDMFTAPDKGDQHDPTNPPTP
jgi:site-specific DNA-methyltransferase (adenine-specific)